MRVLVVSVVLALCLPGCDGGESACAGRSSIRGVVLDVQSRTLTDVRAFTVRSEGEECEIAIDPDRDYGFALSHLNAHKVSADPVTVKVEVRDDELVAVSIEDVV